MNKSIFDSKSEQKVHTRLKTYWSKYVEVFPQIPVRNVIGYDKLQEMDELKSTKDYLLTTSFDFVICELGNGRPILVIEFDGLENGFSIDGKYIVKKESTNDIYRKLKMESKLRVCQKRRVPMIIVSYPECDLLIESEDYITILDAIIGDAIEKKVRVDNYSEHIERLSNAWSFGGEEAAETTEMEIYLEVEEHNPIKRKIREITSKFPFWHTQILFPKIVDNTIEGEFHLKAGRHIENYNSRSQKIVSTKISMRAIGTNDSDFIWLFNTIGEYCLCRKTEKILGYDNEKWELTIQETAWTAD
ncbi:MAG: DUF2726 domain-containing protein [Chitinophagales bacterium]|nr:DUF2726 domain-containing protein [Chitinophagales bacterium]